jgi:hypothetical protein
MVVLPEWLILWTDQEVVQHLVVGEENVGRLETKRVLVGDDGLPAHDPLRFVFLLAHVKPGCNDAFQAGIAWIVSAILAAWSVASAFMG